MYKRKWSGSLLRGISLIFILIIIPLISASIWDPYGIGYLKTIFTEKGETSSGSSYFFNKTATTYTGDLNGYMNATEICNAEFDGTHFCSFAEIQLTTAIKNVTLIDDWAGEFWIASGPAKYSPASLPCNDCNGFTHGVAGSYLGNWWSTDSKGGIGKTGHCGNSLALACCKNW